MIALNRLAPLALVITFAVAMQTAKKDTEATASAPPVVTQPALVTEPAPEASFQSKLADRLEKIEDNFFKKFGNKPFADMNSFTYRAEVSHFTAQVANDGIYKTRAIIEANRVGKSLPVDIDQTAPGGDTAQGRLAMVQKCVATLRTIDDRAEALVRDTAAIKTEALKETIEEIPSLEARAAEVGTRAKVMAAELRGLRLCFSRREIRIYAETAASSLDKI